MRFAADCNLQEKVKESSSLSTANYKQFKDWVPGLSTTPIFQTRNVHGNYIDTVKFFGDLIISKSCENVIKIWKPTYHNNKMRPMVIKELQLSDANIWFMKFGLSPDFELLASGNVKGQLFLFNLQLDKPEKRRVRLEPLIPESKKRSGMEVRQVAFNRDNTIIISVHENSMICRYDLL